MIKGYKCFNVDLTNCYGMKFNVGEKYEINGEQVQFGTRGNGFHMCKNLEDTLIFFGGLCNEVSICEVVGFGVYHRIDDEYKGCYDMYAVEKIEIVKELSREEIIDYAKNLHEIRALKFIQNYKLTQKEILDFENKFINSTVVLDAIEYYQKKNTKVYELKKY